MKGKLLIDCVIISNWKKTRTWVWYGMIIVKNAMRYYTIK